MFTLFYRFLCFWVSYPATSGGLMRETKSVSRASTKRSPSTPFSFTTFRTGQSPRTYHFSVQGFIPSHSLLAQNQQALRDSPEADHFFGAEKRFPCRTGSKIVILEGRYKGEGAVTLIKKFRGQRSGYGAWEHKVIVADSTTFWVKQRDIYFLDPFHRVHEIEKSTALRSQTN